LPGPPPKPAQRRQGTARRDLGLVEAPAVPDIPAPPRGLLKTTREAWAAFWSSPVAAAVDRVSDLATLVRLFELRDERERCWRAVRSERLVLGSKGQPALNPLCRRVSTLDREITALEDRFGLSPLARLKLGVQFHEAARSLEELNRLLARADDDEPDPRISSTTVEIARKETT
jgi:P27 family predicted phage terminase small subunit